jgi:hypothetical protein
LTGHPAPCPSGSALRGRSAGEGMTTAKALISGKSWR